MIFNKKLKKNFIKFINFLGIYSSSGKGLEFEEAMPGFIKAVNE